MTDHSHSSKCSHPAHRQVPLWRRTIQRIFGEAGFTPNPPPETEPGTFALRYGIGSIRGPRHDENEDRCYANRHNQIFLVADGMGGHDGGATASGILAAVVPFVIENSCDVAGCTMPELQHAVDDSIGQARERMIACAEQDPDLDRMGATMALAMVHGTELCYAHVGDARLYLQSNGSFTQLTRDETLVEALVEGGAITEEDAQSHPHRNVILNSVGVRPPDHIPVLRRAKLFAGDRVLLCSDGLTEVLSNDDIHQIMQSHVHPQRAVNALLDFAAKRHNGDDVSCVIVDIESPEVVVKHRELRMAVDFA